MSGQETLASRCVTGGVKKGDVDVSHGHNISTCVRDEVSVSKTRRSHNPGGLVGLDVHRYGALLEQCRNAFDCVTHHRAAHMVGVIVGGQHPRQGHVVIIGDAQNVVDCIGGVNDYTFARVSIANQIDEIHHLVGQGVVGGKVPATQELSKIKSVVRG